MADGVFLTPAEYAVFTRMAAEYTRSRKSKPTRDQIGGLDDNDHPAPESYVAFTPDSGIPALDHALLPTGTGTTALGDDVPGAAPCRIFRVLGDWETGDDHMYPVNIFPVTVYNLSDTAIPGNTWIVITRDKAGYWWALAGGGGGSVSVCGTPRNMIPGTGTGTADEAEECALCVEDPHLTTPVDLFKFDCDFEVESYDSGMCSADVTGTGSEGSGEVFGKTVRVRTRGKTLELTFGVNPIFCESSTGCDVIYQDLTFCFERGRFIGYRLSDVPTCPGT